VFYRGAVRIALDELNRYLESLSGIGPQTSWAVRPEIDHVP
jgi:hypothetical protein